MASLGVYKLDNGEGFPTNCFPVRSLFQQSKEGAGHWFITHRSSVEDRYRTKERSSAEHFNTAPSVLSESEKEQKTPENAENTLNAQLMMKLHCVDKPSDLCSVDISERKLDSVAMDGLEEFDSVAYINASDNHLTLDCFSSFPALRELELSLNSLCMLEVHAVDFPKLQVLDLSYNYLSGDAVLALGLLPCLKVLHLTGNNLQMLPLNMAGPHTPPDEPASQPGSLFQNLEVLMLDENKLSSPEVFNSLANLKRLLHLNLEGNSISEVPYLQPIPAASVPQTQATTAEPTLTRGFSYHGLNTEVANRENEVGFCPALPQLRYLNLARNKIAEEEAVLAVALFPSLSELIIHSNPLTTQKTEDPPMLTWFLQARLGINIIRKKSTHVLKPHLVLSVDPKRKVRTKIPKVPKVPLITAAAYPSDTLTTTEGSGRSNPEASDWSNNAPPLCFPSTSTVEMENDVTAAGGPEIMHEELPKETSSEIQQADEAFFVTEINDLLESEANEGGIRARECPEKLIGFEALLDDDDGASQSLDIPEPAGIQQAVRVLEHALKNLLVYGSSRGNPESLQRPRRGWQKRPNKENMKEIVSEIRERRSIREVPLEKVLQHRNRYRKEYEEALTLLKDMKRKYKMVYAKAAEHAANIESVNRPTEC